MSLTLSTPTVEAVDAVQRTLAGWQDGDLPLQLHPGDVGWHRRLGTPATAAALRTWERNGEVVAIGRLDDGVRRLAVAPAVRRDGEVAALVVADLSDPSRGVLPAGEVSVEAPDGTLVRDLLDEAGWALGEAWTPLRRDLADPVDVPELRVETVGPEQAATYAALVSAGFGSARSDPRRWHDMAAAATYADARSLLAYDGDVAAAAVTVWSAGPGRPGLVEPLAVHPDHRNRGLGRGLTLASFAALRELGASHVEVCTPSTLTGAVATYRSVGMTVLPERHDRVRRA